MTSPDNHLTTLTECGAFLSGHFKLSSGLHSAHYLQCAQLFQYPWHSETISAALIAKIHNNGICFDAVVSPALGGILFGYEVSRCSKTPNIFTERDTEGKMSLRRGFRITPGQRFLVVEDVVTTGRSTREVMDVVEQAGGLTVAVGCVANRSQKENPFNVPFFSIVTLDFPTYDPAVCPLCRDGQPVIKPGSRNEP